MCQWDVRLLAEWKSSETRKKKLAQSLAALFNLSYMKYVFNYVITYIGTDDLDCSFVLPLKTNNSNEIQHARDDDEPLTPTSNKKKLDWLLSCLRVILTNQQWIYYIWTGLFHSLQKAVSVTRDPQILLCVLTRVFKGYCHDPSSQAQM